MNKLDMVFDNAWEMYKDTDLQTLGDIHKFWRQEFERAVQMVEIECLQVEHEFALKEDDKLWGAHECVERIKSWRK